MTLQEHPKSRQATAAAAANKYVGDRMVFLAPSTTLTGRACLLLLVKRLCGATNAPMWHNMQHILCHSNLGCVLLPEHVSEPGMISGQPLNASPGAQGLCLSVLCCLSFYFIFVYAAFGCKKKQTHTQASPGF